MQWKGKLKSFLSLAVCMACLGLGAPVAAQTAGSIAGEYTCRSMGSQPCDTSTTIALHADGTWSWRYLNGNYKISGTEVTFQGPGLGGWGPARIGRDTLTFVSGADAVVYAKPSAPSRAEATEMAGAYRCAASPGGCQTFQAVVIGDDGTWTFGAQHGNVVISAGHVQFTGGLSSGPAHWGVVDLSNGILVFHAKGGSSRWVKSEAPSHPCDPRIPNYRQPGCTK